MIGNVLIAKVAPPLLFHIVNQILVRGLPEQVLRGKGLQPEASTLTPAEAWGGGAQRVKRAVARTTGPHGY